MRGKVCQVRVLGTGVTCKGGRQDEGVNEQMCAPKSGRSSGTALGAVATLPSRLVSSQQIPLRKRVHIHFYCKG